MPKRKNVRFVADQDREEPSDEELLRLSAKRRVGDATMDSGEGVGSRRATTYDSIGQQGGNGDAEFPKRHASSKHTLDSDEEDDNVQNRLEDRLDTDEVEGQEETTVEFDDETKIVPFNVRDELEDGYYDTEGNFVFSKKKEQIKDEWLDNIDWTTVKSDAGALWREDKDENAENDLTSESEVNVEDKARLYAKVLQYMTPGETLTRTLRRLGGAKKSAAEIRRDRWRQKRAADDAEQASTTTTAESHSRDDVAELTGFVDKLVDCGEFDIYGCTFERVKFLSQVPKPAPVLDMFSADEPEQPDGAAASSDAPQKAPAAQGCQEVMWEFKWQNEPDAQISGPHSSAQMQQWKEDNYFKQTGVWVRRLDQQQQAPDSTAPFYSSNRVDFDLFT